MINHIYTYFKKYPVSPSNNLNPGGHDTSGYQLEKLRSHSRKKMGGLMGRGLGADEVTIMKDPSGLCLSKLGLPFMFHDWWWRFPGYPILSNLSLFISINEIFVYFGGSSKFKDRLLPCVPIVWNNRTKWNPDPNSQIWLRWSSGRLPGMELATRQLWTHQSWSRHFYEYRFGSVWQ